MPAQAELDALVAAVAATESGVSVQTLEQGFPYLPRRTLQRRLANLVARGRLRATGRGPSRRYHTATAVIADASPEPLLDRNGPGVGVPAIEEYIPLSAQSAELRALVRRPVSQRTPAGYRREFLDGYMPNRTFYLPHTLREHLLQLGSPATRAQPAGTYARQILDRLLVDLSWASSRLEGNTYSRLDTQNLIEFGRYAEGKDRLEAQMILNHKAAIEMLVDQAELIGFNRYTVQNLHALLADNLLDATSCGRLRTIDVGITGTVFHPTAIPQVIEDCLDEVLAKAALVEDPFEQSFFAMVHLPYLQPFVDVNKRVSRLAANIPLIRRNLAPLSFVDVPQAAYVDGTLAVYELNRVELLREVFAWAYERSCQRYTLIKQALPAPDPLRLRYRAALGSVVGTIVRDRLPASATWIRTLASDQVAGTDMDSFIAMALNELLLLHEGNIARYRLLPSEFRQWKEATAMPP
jgi:hypothetical protein